MKLHFKNLILFFRAFFHVIFTTKKTDSKVFRKILVFQTAKLGDMVCTTPVFRAIKDKFPNSCLVVAGNSINKEILKGNKDIDNYIVINESESIFKKVKEIKKHNFDVAILMGPNYFSLLLAIFSNINFIVAPRPVGGKSICTKTYSFLIKFIRNVDFRFGYYAPQERLNILKPLGILSENTKKVLYYSPEALKKVENLLSERNNQKLVGLSLTAGNKIKEWPLNRFVEVASYIKSKYNASIILIGGSNDLDLSKKFEEKLGNDNNKLLNTVGKLSIDELKAIISKLDLFISVDTGPIYIAEAFDVATIDIVGPMNEKEQPPHGPRNINIIPSNRIKPELSILNSRIYNEEEARKQVWSISAKDVIRSVDFILSFKNESK